MAEVKPPAAWGPTGAEPVAALPPRPKPAAPAAPTAEADRSRLDRLVEAARGRGAPAAGGARAGDPDHKLAARLQTTRGYDPANLRVEISDFSRKAIDRYMQDQTLTVPDYCETSVLGTPAKPFRGNTKKGGVKAMSNVKKVLEMISTNMPCLVFRKECMLVPARDRNAKGELGTYHQRYFNKEWNQKPLAAKAARVVDVSPGALGTCAIVGNADNVMKENFGPEIDGHDFIVRFNVRTKGFESKVGSRADGIFDKDNYRKGRSAGQQVPDKLWMFRKHWTANYNLVDKGKPMIMYGEDVRVWRDYVKKIFALAKAKNAKATGGMARLLAMAELARIGACTRLDIYGFSSGGGKYFQRSAKVQGIHNANLEHYVRQWWMHSKAKGPVCVYGN